MEYCYLNGTISPVSEAKVSVLDIGMLRGFGIYDGLTAFGENIFRFGNHWNRFVDGAHALNLNIPVTLEKCQSIIKELLSKNGFERSIIRMVLTGGNTLGGIEYDFASPTFYILIEKLTALPENLYVSGGKLVTQNFQRDLPEYKTTNYIRAVNLQNFRKEEGAMEILFTHDGEVLECATSNIFLVKDGVLITPAERVLKGITRKVILEITPSLNYKIEERIVEEKELQEAQEIFITSSFKDIVPITKIDDFVVGNGGVGPITKELMAEFAKVLNLS